MKSTKKIWCFIHLIKFLTVSPTPHDFPKQKLGGFSHVPFPKIPFGGAKTPSCDTRIHGPRARSLISRDRREKAAPGCGCLVGKGFIRIFFIRKCKGFIFWDSEMDISDTFHKFN